MAKIMNFFILISYKAVCDRDRSRGSTISNKEVQFDLVRLENDHFAAAFNNDRISSGHLLFQSLANSSSENRNLTSCDEDDAGTVTPPSNSHKCPRVY
jgi:hypothetical protein